MNLLLPHRFKKIGAIIAPLGFALWVSMQRGLLTTPLTWLLGENMASQNPSLIHAINVFIAFVSFYSFLAGMYFISFSKEKVEDEMIKKTRLDSFYFAALLQIIFIIIGFSIMILYKEPKDGGLMLFFISAIFIFWLSFIGRFNYILHFSLKKLDEELH